MTAPGAPGPGAADPGAPTALWEDFADIFYAPGRVFARRRDGRFGPALAASVAVGLVLFFAFRPMFEAVIEAAIEQQIAQNPAFTPEQAAGARETGVKLGLVTGVAQATLGYPLLITVVATLVWLVGKASGSAQRFGQAMVIAAYANLPRVLGTVVGGLLFALGHPERVRSPFSVLVSPLRFMDEGAFSPVAAALLSRFDLFTLWATALIAVGLHVTGGLPRGRAAMAAGTVWLVATMFGLASAARGA